MGTSTGNVITLANSIVGVSVLAMPFCFKQCGILLAVLMLLFSNIITRLACHYLLKAAILEKRKNFEMLAFRVYGPTGKLFVELSIIGFMLGTCVAYFVILGDLGPGILGPAFGFQDPTALRPSVLIGIAMFVVLPLGLLKNVDSLSAICAASLAFYGCLVLKVMGEAINHLIAFDWMEKVYFWRPAGILQCIPIFSMALSCQTQLFEIFDPLPSNSLERMNADVKSAINMVTLFYISMGFFGYIAFCDQTFAGNLIMNFSPTISSEVIKMGFVLSVAVSFPLVIFPCRASIHSLFFSKGYEHAQTGSAHIPETRFKCITLLIVTVSLVTGILMPNIEVVLGLVGSTIGVIICVIIPSIIFLSLTFKNNNERLVAKFLVVTGLVIMVLGTYANLYATEEAVSGPERNIPLKNDGSPILPKILGKVSIKDETLKNIKDVDELAALPELKPVSKNIELPVLKGKQKIEILPVVAGKKDSKNVHEPPVPVEPVVIHDVKKEPPVPEEPVIIHEKKKEPPVPEAPVEIKEPSKDTFINKKPKVLLETNQEPLVPVEPSDAVEKAAEPPKTVEDKEKDTAKSLPALGGKEKLTQATENPVLKVEEEKAKEKIIEKIKEHEEAQKKLNEEGVKLLKEIKDYVNKTNDDTLKLVNVKTGVVTDVKPDQKQKNYVKDAGYKKNLSKDNNGIAMKLAKGIPLPVAVKEQLTEDSKKKVVENNKENEVDKLEVGKDLLGGVKEMREKRDIEEVLKEASQPEDLESKILTSTPANVLDKEVSFKKSEPFKGSESLKTNDNEVEQLQKETISKLKVELENCVKNDSNKDQVQANEMISNEIKLDKLIKSPNYLSDSNPDLSISPQLMNEAKVSKDGLPDMPKKRDLKSVSDDQLNENKRIP